MNLRILGVGLCFAALLTGCGGSSKYKVPTPNEAICRQKKVNLDIYNRCLLTGMTRPQVEEILGAGKPEQGAPEGAEIWAWGDGATGSMTALFRDGELRSKAQIGLK